MTEHNEPGMFNGSPEGYNAPHPLLTDWVGFDGGFNAWAHMLPNGYLLLCTNENGEDSFAVEGDENWTLLVLRLSDTETVHNSEASPLNLATTLEALVAIDWKGREDL